MSLKYYNLIRTQFNDVAIKGLGASVTLTPVIKTINNTYGDEILADGTSRTITVYIVRKNTKWFADNAGELGQADLLMLAKHTESLNKNDKITYLNNNYRIDTILDRTAGEGQVVYKVCSLYLI